ncbi:MAG TPA: hypothetical protein VE826_09695, partial [Dongiaceae bacterium]|nr:hypothetical protein [Dongiaceae bacterium]
VEGDRRTIMISFATATTASANAASFGKARRTFARSEATYEGTTVTPPRAIAWYSAFFASAGATAGSLTLRQRAVLTVDLIDDLRRGRHEPSAGSASADQRPNRLIFVPLHHRLERSNVVRVLAPPIRVDHDPYNVVSAPQSQLSVCPQPLTEELLVAQFADRDIGVEIEFVARHRQ